MDFSSFGVPDNEELEWRRQASVFGSQHLRPTALQDDAAHRFRRDIFAKLASHRFHSLALGRNFGGSGQRSVCYYAVLEELARASAAFCVSVSVTNLVQGALASHGTVAQRGRFLRPLAAGDWLGAFSLSEAQSGSDASALRLQVTKVDKGYSLRGTKMWCSNAADADIFLVMGRTGPDKTRGISAFLVPKNTPGFRIGKLENKMGLWASSLAELIFEDAFVPEDNLLAKERHGFEIALNQLDGGRISIGTIGVGIALEAIDRTWKYLSQQSKTQGISFDEGAKQCLAAHFANALSVRALIREASMLRDRGETVPALTSSIKMLGSDLAMRASSDSLTLLGPAGARPDLGVERCFRDAKALQIVEGTNQIQLVVLARQLERILQ